MPTNKSAGKTLGKFWLIKQASLSRFGSKSDLSKKLDTCKLMLRDFLVLM